MNLETARLRFATWESTDVDAFRPVATDPDVMRYITGGVPWTEEQIREFIARQMNHFQQRGFCLWKLLDKFSGRLIGFCGLQPLTLDGADEVEIGWWLAKDQWGKGLATEAALAALRFAFEQAHLARVIAIARLGNAASIRIMRKLGMRFECATLHKSVPVVVYSIAAEPIPGQSLPG